MATFWGHDAPGAAGDTYFGNLALINNTAVVEYPCAGTLGTSQDAVELSAYLSVSGNVRLAVYSNDLSTKICEGSAAVAVAADAAFQGHIGAANITGGAGALTGGTKYVLALSIHDNNTKIWWTLGSAVVYNLLKSADYTGGFPSSLSGFGNYNTYRHLCIRCGVDPAAATGTLRLLADRMDGDVSRMMG